MSTEPTREILVGIDGSAGSEAALRWAYRTAQVERRPVTALLGWTADGLPRPVYQAAAAAEHGALAAAAAQMLDRTIARVPAPQPAVELRRLVVDQDPVDALVAEAKNAAMTVVGARGPGLAHRILAGSVAHRLLHRSSGPVVVVRGTADEAGHADETASQDRRPVVVGVDGSESSQAAVRWAAAQAAERGAPLHLVYGYRVDITSFGVSVDEFYPSLRTDAERLLADVATAGLDDEADLEVRQLAVDDTPTRALLRASAEAQLLAVGTRGRGGFAELVLGSTAHQCVLHADCPVAVLHA
ncbi:universal stress protein UspA [Parafrankia colletiae]|uniref:Universal stress protein UspA n=1 Tax=Parafrankia colletiae TaxID=573497 RepID=A0A1S1R5C3_9ACTN|nr:universal stress protein [Parafrankia colletiae]MCK9901572.1 universal stress protein [Frankia sp. Cpl3]OHV41106.1 universal stress protein UspA [Parafrankia colletiae]